MQKLRRTCCSDSCTFNTVYCFQFALYHQYVSVMLSIYAKLSSEVLAIQEREREREREGGITHERNCVYLSKIENSSYHQELVSHPMPEHVEELIGF